MVTTSQNISTTLGSLSGCIKNVLPIILSQQAHMCTVNFVVCARLRKSRGGLWKVFQPQVVFSQFNRRMNEDAWGGGLMNSTMFFAQETHSAICQYELQGERPGITTGSIIWAGNEWAVYGSLLTVIEN